MRQRVRQTTWSYHAAHSCACDVPVCQASSARPVARDQVLDLAFLVYAEDKGSVRWGQVKADDIAYLVDEQRIARQLECLATVWLQAERRPHSADRGVGKARFRTHRADRPVRRVNRRRA